MIRHFLCQFVPAVIITTQIHSMELLFAIKFFKRVSLLRDFSVCKTILHIADQEYSVNLNSSHECKRRLRKHFTQDKKENQTNFSCDRFIL